MNVLFLLSAAAFPAPLAAQSADPHQHHTAAQPAQPAPPVDHSTMDHGAMDHGPADTIIVAHEDHAMRGALGRYPMVREASGTAWQPDGALHSGVMTRAGDWSLMGHARLNLVYDWQGGPRGDSKTFVSGMVMGMAQRPVGAGVLQLRAALSPDPLMGKSGYPLLLASGETADGETHLVDRQHPHDLFMEASASLSQPLGRGIDAFVYAGLPGEPAFGPPAFMHRQAVADSPEAPISHHWLDSTHISFGVVTAGLIVDNFKIEASRFNGREPDQRRYNIETGPLDSTAVRLSWNPLPVLSLQACWGRFIAPEQLEPDENQTRWSASALYADRLGPGHVSGTLAWGRKSHDGRQLDAVTGEMGYRQGPWTGFFRAEWAENDELVEEVAARVGKASLGAIYDVPLAPAVSLGLGGLVSRNVVPNSLDAAYGGDRNGAMAFVRLKVE